MTIYRKENNQSKPAVNSVLVIQLAASNIWFEFKHAPNHILVHDCNSSVAFTANNTEIWSCVQTSRIRICKFSWWVMKWIDNIIIEAQLACAANLKLAAVP
jgi:hypothetical protein